MTSRERWLAALDCQPVDRLPFYPKILDGYAPHQTEPFRSMSPSDLHRWIGSDEHVLFGPSCVQEIRHRTRIEVEERDSVRRTTYRTPAGELAGLDRFDEPSRSWHPTEFAVKSAADIEAMWWVYADATYEFDPDQLEEATMLIDLLGESGIAASALGRSPLMNWLESIAGVESGHFLLADHPEAVGDLFEQMHRMNCRCAEIMADGSPYEFVYSVEDTSTTLISPDQFRCTCARHLTDYGRILGCSGKRLVLHMCGQIKELLPDIAVLPAAGIEALTTLPIGNTSLLDARTACPEMCLVGGTNAMLWLEPPEVIIRTIERDLDALPHHRGIVVSSAGVLPPGARPETLKAVAGWLRRYECRC